MQRFRMESSDGFYVEHTDRNWLINLRQNDYRFRNARIKDILQLIPSEVVIGQIYAPRTNAA